ncbi:hypothetical protein ABZ490_50200, partial [Streptomyces sp. NPDC005811]|uniref:hypothetical protein n=1 Tax=Streptomyces sp. NPDC005811 TaxID=3154565 RepID=UPI0033ED890D
MDEPGTSSVSFGATAGFVTSVRWEAEPPPAVRERRAVDRGGADVPDDAPLSGTAGASGGAWLAEPSAAVRERRAVDRGGADVPDDAPLSGTAGASGGAWL